jgi:hypothetical protein
MTISSPSSTKASCPTRLTRGEEIETGSEVGVGTGVGVVVGDGARVGASGVGRRAVGVTEGARIETRTEVGDIADPDKSVGGC